MDTGYITVNLLVDLALLITSVLLATRKVQVVISGGIMKILGTLVLSVRQDLMASTVAALGIDTDTTYISKRGRPMKIANGGKIIEGLV